jgi:signal transduction histidine kinase
MLLYPDGPAIDMNDFDTAKDFLSNINRILYEKKKAKFDKVRFARLVPVKIDINKLPQVISNIFAKAELFAKKKKFVTN